MSTFKIGLAVLSAMTIVACQSTPIAIDKDRESTIANRVVGEYRLGATDRLRVTVFAEPELSGEYVLDGEGLLSLPLIGEVGALNSTVRELQNQVTEKYANGYLRNPRINIEVLNYRPFYILGEVNAPGEYPYTSGLTVLNAVATAGGFTYRANDDLILIRGADDSEEYRVKLEPATRIMPGDTIRVIERFF